MDEDEYREPHAGDDPVAAFERLRGEVSLLRHAVEGLAAARENIEFPDYEPTLERTEKILVALAQRIDPIAKSPLLSMTPDSMASQIATAAIGARREDARLVAEARAGLDQAAREIGNRLASARHGDEQNRWLYVMAACGAVLGLLLYAFLAGPIARATPDSWRWPERIEASLEVEQSGRYRNLLSPADAAIDQLDLSAMLTDIPVAVLLAE